VGNVLEDAAYQFGQPDRRFDLIYTFDVIQQLPPREQYRAVEQLLDRLDEGGIAVVFDNDKRSRFGRVMARKKFLTRYLGLRLVPRYYCNARYPPLADFAERLNRSRRLPVALEVSPGGAKRALILRG
jgi:SAM-dependent methyltransferase